MQLKLFLFNWQYTFENIQRNNLINNVNLSNCYQTRKYSYKCLIALVLKIYSCTLQLVTDKLAVRYM